MTRTLFLLVVVLCLPTNIVAQNISDAPRLPIVDDVVAAAVTAERAGELERAADLYLWASAYDAELSRFLRYRAVSALLALPQPPADRVAALAKGMVDWGYDGVALAAVRAESVGGGLPTLPTLRTALETDDREMVCADLVEEIGAMDAEGLPVDPGYFHAQHGWCSDTELPSLALKAKVEPDDESRVRRAERLYGNVRFTATLEELDALGDLAQIDDLQLRCRAMFVRARALYRLRKRRSESNPMYEATAGACKEPAVRQYRKKSLYALGKRHWDLGDSKRAKPQFEALLAEFPRTSHADDALFYLARVARAEKDRERELELMRRAVAEYPDGDMVGEIIWETVEILYREGKHAEFIELVESVARPERDDQYYSQGRLEYYVAQSHLALNRKELALESWQRAWTQYPWSFYGYLSRMRVLENGGAPAPIRVEPESVPPWLDAAPWHAGGVGRLSKLGQPDFAAASAGTIERKSDADRWRVAYVYDRGGRYHVSHNIVRRSIGGRPWSDPLEARATQWSLAWPDPFGTAVDAAVEAEKAQAGVERVTPGLPRAIMREESSFIPDIESYAGALGLMQLMPRTALGHDDDIEGDATPERLKDPDVNVRVGVDHLFWLGKRFDGHPVLIVAAYNAGAGAVGKWLRAFGNEDPALFIEDIPRLQTRDYTKRVIGSYAYYQWLSRGEIFDDRVLNAAK